MEDMEYILRGIAAIVIIVLLCIANYSKRQRPKVKNTRNTKNTKNNGVDTTQFQNWKERISHSCDEQTLIEFMDFLKKYKGGYVQRRNGEIIYQGFLGREKGELKGIFYHKVVPARNVSIKQKELFRTYLQGIGVTGLEQRPAYELRSGKLKADSRNEEEYHRKLSGNRGEQRVRNCLKILNDASFSVLNGIVLRDGEQVKEFDHIIVGDTGVFVLETKAFGMSDKAEDSDKARLTIDADGQWKLYKHHNMRILKNPTEQILEEKRFMEGLLEETFVEVKTLLVLANENLAIEKRSSLDYDVVMLKDLVCYITKYKGKLSDSDKYQIISKLQEHRVN